MSVITIAAHLQALASKRAKVGMAFGVVVAALLGGASPVLAEPVVAQAEVGAADANAPKSGPLQDRAILAARRAALVLALDEVPSTGEDASQRGVILSRYQLWTSSYRVLEVAPTAAGMRVQVEVEIDVPRLQKQLSLKKDDGQAVYAWGRAHVQGECSAPEMQEEAIQAALQDLGVLRADAPATLSMQLTCKSLGPVSFTRFVAAKVEARVKFGDREERLSRSGFATEPERAQASAYAELFNGLVDRLAADSALELRIRVHEPWPASRLRHLERVLRESIPGVQSAQLLGVTGQGDAILSVKSSLSANRLGESLSQVRFPGFDIEELRVQSKRSMSIRWSKGPGDQPIDVSSQPADPPMAI